MSSDVIIVTNNNNKTQDHIFDDNFIKEKEMALEPINDLFPRESSRNSAFEQLIDYALCYDGIPSDEEVEELLGAISMSL